MTTNTSASTVKKPMPSHAQVVIIGGGVMGCSLAYHLSKEGWKDILLLEKGELTSGSTWHAAGLVTHSISHYGIASMARYATSLYPQLEEETGQSCTWHGCGSLRMVYNSEQLDWLRYTLSTSLGLGVDLEIIGPEEINRVHPFYNTEGVIAALHTPDDGHVDPAGVAFALARGARSRGVRIIRQNRATGMERTAAGEWRVDTEQGPVLCDIVVNAGGTYAPQIGRWVGIDIPMANMLHHYFITEPVPEFADLEKELPVVRDDTRVSGYTRMEQKSGLIGIYEKLNPKTVWDEGTPWEADSELFEPDYDRVMPWLQGALERMPVLAKLGIRRVVHGAITHPPDGNLMLGPSSLPGLWMCCGAQIGISWGPGAGKYLAQWMTYGAADISMHDFDWRRFGARIDSEYCVGKGKEDYRLRHEIPYPHRDRPDCRPSHSRLSPLYEILKERGAVYENVYGWERAQWFAPEGVEREHIHSFRRSPLFDIVGAEVQGLRESAGILDASSFSKIEVRGGDAAVFLSRLQANSMPRREGAISLAYFLTEGGRIEEETSLLKLAEDRFYIIYAAVREAAFIDWLRTQIKEREEVEVINLTQELGVLILSGPASRDILAQCTEAPLDNASFPWLSSREIKIAGAPVRAIRISFSGDLGWELHMGNAHMEKVYRALVEAGQPLGLVHVGTAALNSMRMEKAYPAGAELTPEVTMAEADLRRFVGPHDFQGRQATLEPSSHWLLAYLEIDEPDAAAPRAGEINPEVDAEKVIEADPAGHETVWIQGSQDWEHIGSISSAAFGHSVGKSLAFAYLKPKWAAPGSEVFVLVLGRRRRARVLGQAAWDPDHLRPRLDAA